MNTNTNTSGMSEIRELTDDELDAVNGGAVDAFVWYGCANGSHIGQYQTGGSGDRKAGE
jgi:bacteriocin-like protein